MTIEETKAINKAKVIAEPKAIKEAKAGLDLPLTATTESALRALRPRLSLWH